MMNMIFHHPDNHVHPDTFLPRTMTWSATNTEWPKSGFLVIPTKNQQRDDETDSGPNTDDQ